MFICTNFPILFCNNDLFHFAESIYLLYIYRIEINKNEWMKKSGGVCMWWCLRKEDEVLWYYYGISLWYKYSVVDLIRP